MSSEEPAGLNLQQIQVELVRAQTPEQCLELAAAADGRGATDLKQAALQRAVALDRSCQPALLNLAATALDEEDLLSAFAFLEEAARVAPLPPEIAPLREQLYSSAKDADQLQPYLRAIGRVSVERTSTPLSILLLTDRYEHEAASTPTQHDPADLARALVERGHQVRVLTSADEPAAARSPAGIQILRSLQPISAHATSGVASRLLRDNLERVRTAVTKSGAELVVAVSLDTFGIGLLQPALHRRMAVVHLLAQPKPTFGVDEQPREDHYAIAPASDWTGTSLRAAGFETRHMETIYPGTALDRTFRLFLPDVATLRLCAAASLAAQDGLEALLDALVLLKRRGVTASLTLAANEPSDETLSQVQQDIAGRDLTEIAHVATGVEWTTLLSRCNVFVSSSPWPTSFERRQVDAMAAGVVVATTAAGGTKELVQDGIDGLHIRGGDAADLADKLQSLLQDRGLFEKLQRAAQARASIFSLQATVGRLEKLAVGIREGFNSPDLDPGYGSAL